MKISMSGCLEMKTKTHVYTTQHKHSCCKFIFNGLKKCFWEVSWERKSSVKGFTFLERVYNRQHRIIKGITNCYYCYPSFPVFIQPWITKSGKRDGKSSIFGAVVYCFTISISHGKCDSQPYFLREVRINWGHSPLNLGATQRNKVPLEVSRVQAISLSWISSSVYAKK